MTTITLSTVPSRSGESFYLSFKGDFLFKSPVNKTNLTDILWTYDGKSLTHILTEKVLLNVVLETQKDTNICYTVNNTCLDRWDDSTEKVEWYRKNNSYNQKWIIHNIDSTISYQMKYFVSSNDTVRDKIVTPNYDSVMIFYHTPTIKSSREAMMLLSYIPSVATDGDTHIVLKDGSRLRNPDIPTILEKGLITPVERRKARKIIVVSENMVYASGGYRSKITHYSEPWPVTIISASGNQFEIDYLEAKDFIVKVGEGRDMNPLFPHLYPSGYKPGYSDVDNYDSVKLLSGDYLLTGSYITSMTEDLLLYFNSFSVCSLRQRVKDPVILDNGWIRLSAIGMGFFSNYMRREDISKYLYPVLSR